MLHHYYLKLVYVGKRLFSRQNLLKLKSHLYLMHLTKAFSVFLNYSFSSLDATLKTKKDNHLEACKNNLFVSFRLSTEAIFRQNLLILTVRKLEIK